MLRTLLLPLAAVFTFAAFAQTTDTIPGKNARKARVSLDRNEPYRALKRCTKGLEQKVPDLACYALRAEAYNRIGDPRQAIVDARKGAAHPPSRSSSLLQLGIGYQTIGMRDSAEWAYRSVLGTEMGTEARYRLAMVERETGRASGALADLALVTATEPANARYLRERGVTQAMLGDSAAARADLDKAIELEPKNPVNWNTRGFQRYAAFGEHKRAIEDYNMAIKLDKNHGYAFNNRGWSRYKLGDTEGGLRDMKLAGRKNRSNAMVLRNLGVMAFEQGKTQLACEQWRTALDMDFTARFGTEVEDLVKAHCGKTISAAPKDIQDRNAPKPAPPPRRGNAP